MNDTRKRLAGLIDDALTEWDNAASDDRRSATEFVSTALAEHVILKDDLEQVGAWQPDFYKGDDTKYPCYIVRSDI